MPLVAMLRSFSDPDRPLCFILCSKRLRVTIKGLCFHMNPIHLILISYDIHVLINNSEKNNCL